MYYAHHSTTSIQSTSIHSWSLLKYVAKERAPRARADTRVLEANLHTHLTPNQSYLDSILFTTDYYDSIEREKENHPLSIHWPHSSISLCFHSPFGRDVPRFLTRHVLLIFLLISNRMSSQPQYSVLLPTCGWMGVVDGLDTTRRRTCRCVYT